MNDFTLGCNGTVRRKKPQEQSCEIFLKYFDSGNSERQITYAGNDQNLGAAPTSIPTILPPTSILANLNRPATCCL